VLSAGAKFSSFNAVLLFAQNVCNNVSSRHGLE
jgi:hypothetical protein